MPETRPTPEPRSAYLAFETVPLRWNDCDLYGHLYNATYYEIFDCAMTQWLAHSGLIDDNCQPTSVVVENGCVYFEEVCYPNAIEVGLRITHLGTCSVRFEMALFKEGADLAAAQAFFAAVRVSEDEHRPIPIPDDQRIIYQRLIAP